MNIPFNTKTCYSFLDSTIKIDDLIDYAKENNINDLFICDNNMYGVMEFIYKCKSNNINPIIGLDLGDFLLFAKSYIGYQNLLKFNTFRETNELNIDNTELKNYTKDLIFVPVKNNEIESIFSDIKKANTRPVRCLKKEDIETLYVLNLIKDNKTKSDTYEFNKDVLPVENDLSYFINNCHIEFPKYSINIPNYVKVNNIDSTTKDYIRELANTGLKKRLGSKINESYINRLNYELDIIEKLNFSNYFLVVYDYIKYAKLNNILVGPGRGSVCGSLVAFSLGITDIDPIKYGIIFERFLSLERSGFPDIDTDFPDDKIDDVISYVKDKYGEYCVSKIVTFSTYKLNSTINDLGKVYNLKDYQIKDLNYIIRETIERTNLDKNKVKLIDIYKESYKFKKTIDSDINLKNMFKDAIKIEGMPRHNSIHASGLIISGERLDNIVPINLENGIFVAGYENSYLEKLNLLKFDFLSLHNLTQIKNILDEVNLSFSKIPYNDSKTYELFSKGLTSGIFQLENRQAKKFLKEIKPDNFMEIVFSSAVIRPGSYSFMDSYVDRKINPSHIDYYDERLKDILFETKGVITYQDQIMEIVSTMSGMTLGYADVIRKAISKKKIDLINNFEKDFKLKAKNNNFSDNVINIIFDKIKDFANFGFNKSHSIAYGTICYKMGYLKANYPDVFYKVMLKESSSSDTLEYLKELKTLGFKLLKPSVNKSTNEFILENNTCILPITSIKGLNKIIGERIIENRPYNSIFDFFKKINFKNINKITIENIINSGLLDELGYNKKTLIENLDVLLNYSNLSEFDALEPYIEEKEEYSDLELIEREYNSLGMNITSNIVSYYKKSDPDSNKLIDLEKIENYINKDILLIGRVNKIREIKTKNDEEMAFMDIIDFDSNISVTIFPEKYKKYKEILEKCDIIKIRGKVDKRVKETSVILNEMWRLS